MASDPIQPRAADEHVVCVVAGGNHLTIELDGAETGGAMDAIEVLAQPGGGPPPHRHDFDEWFLVRAGTLTICEERGGAMICTRDVAAGGSFWVPAGTWHGTLNLTDGEVRFQTIGRPGKMTGYFADAGVVVADPNAAPRSEPPGPEELGEIAARWGIEFWTGPIDRRPPPRR